MIMVGLLPTPRHLTCPSQSCSHASVPLLTLECTKHSLPPPPSVHASQHPKFLHDLNYKERRIDNARTLECLYRLKSRRVLLTFRHPTSPPTRTPMPALPLTLECTKHSLSPATVCPCFSAPHVKASLSRSTPTAVHATELQCKRNQKFIYWVNRAYYRIGANHTDTPRAGGPVRPHKILQHRVGAICNSEAVLKLQLSLFTA